MKVLTANLVGTAVLVALLGGVAEASGVRNLRRRPDR
jgi:hypothetical protein